MRESKYHAKIGFLKNKLLAAVPYGFITYNSTRFRKKVEGVYREKRKRSTEIRRNRGLFPWFRLRACSKSGILALQTPKFYLAGSKRARKPGFLRSIDRKKPQFEQALKEVPVEKFPDRLKQKRDLAPVDTGAGPLDRLPCTGDSRCQTNPPGGNSP
jgi:hypothetical protein